MDISDNAYKSLSTDQITSMKTVLISIILLLWPVKSMAFCFFFFFWRIPSQFLLQGSSEGRWCLPSSWRLALSRSLWLDILLTEAGFKVFLPKHKLELWKRNGARWLKAMLIRGNKTVFLLHLWPLMLTRSLRSWALDMGTNYRQRGYYGAVEVDPPGF